MKPDSIITVQVYRNGWTRNGRAEDLYIVGGGDVVDRHRVAESLREAGFCAIDGCAPACAPFTAEQEARIRDLAVQMVDERPTYGIWNAIRGDGKPADKGLSCARP